MFHERRSSDIMRSTPQRNMNGGQRSGRSTNSSTNGDMDFSLSINQDALPVTSVAVPISTGAQLLINACGRTVALEMQCARTILDLQSALQTKLQMEAQTFHFFDVHGATLATDAQVHDAITQGATPLCATLTDASIHFIENRREELAQMQWKLMRDQLGVVNVKMDAIGRQSRETQTELERYKQECMSLIDRNHAEAIKCVESERDVTTCEWRQLSERVNAVVQLLNSERQKRDAAIQGLEKQVSGLRDLLENERGARRQDLALHFSAVQDVKARLDSEEGARQEIQDKQAFDIHIVSENIEAIKRHVTEMLQDQQLEAAKREEDFQGKFQANFRMVTQVRADVDASVQELKVRVQNLDERCSLADNRISDVATKQLTRVDNLAERHERVSQVVESLRLEEKQSQNQLQVAFSKVKDIELTIQQMEDTTRDLITKEREGRDDHMRRTHVAIRSEHQRMISELEDKVSERLERESCARERAVQLSYQDSGQGAANVMRNTSAPAKKESMRVRAIEASSFPATPIDQSQEKLSDSFQSVGPATTVMSAFPPSMAPSMAGSPVLSPRTTMLSASPAAFSPRPAYVPVTRQVSRTSAMPGSQRQASLATPLSAR
mmetsp:Transcript_123694/g.231423  ORF Transcript_123694/g.231423 Transcript_123694/m.231423 type:complete len:611 (+) Transcript_123694:85-1917(+)